MKKKRKRKEKSMNWRNLINLYGEDELFRGLKDGLPQRADYETAKETIIDFCLLYEPLWAEGDFLRRKIKTWAKRSSPVWQRLWEGYLAEYNPVENYDRKEEWSDLTDYENRNKNYQPRANDTTREQMGIYTDGAYGDGTNANTHQGRIHGNIGVTTAPQMLREQYQVQPKINFYDELAREFFSEFCVRIG